MSDRFGDLTLPVTPSGATLDDAVSGKADPTGYKLLTFVRAAIERACSAAWSELRPREDAPGARVVRKAALRDPKKGQLDSEKDLPALFLWRRQGPQEQAYDDFRVERATFSLLWLMPPDGPQKEARREPFMAAIMKAASAAIQRGRDPAWVDPGDPDPKAPSYAADDDSVVLPLGTSTSPVTLSGAALTGIVGGAVMSPRRGLTFTTAPAAGAYNPDDPIVITYVDWMGRTTTAAVYLDEDGGEVVNPTAEPAQVVSIAIPGQQLATGSIRVGTVAREGRGSSLLSRAGLMRCDFGEWAPIDVPIQILDSDSNVVDTKTYYGALATITAVEQLVRDAAANAWPIAVPPAGVDIDVAIDGEVVTRAEL